MTTLTNAAGAALLLTLWIATLGAAQDRTALVIANFDYGEHQLPAVTADAASVGEGLRREGFRVTVAENLPVKELKSTIGQFTRGTVTRGTAVLYFAGLAGQYQTYHSKGAWWSHLQGAGKPNDPRNPVRDSLALAEIVKLFADHAASSTNLLVLDAARPNPFLAEQENRPVGLAAVAAEELPHDVLVLMAAQPGSMAGQLSGRSLLAASLSKHLPLGRQSVGKMLQAAGNEVGQQSGGGQRPWFVAGSGQPLASSWPPDKNPSFLDSLQPREGSKPGQQWINGLGMVFCWCPPGKFTMGLSETDSPATKDAGQVEVTLPQGFWMGKYEFTQREYFRLRGRGPLAGTAFVHHNAPLTNMKHGDAASICRMLTELEREAGRLPEGWQYALPTEAQWEYACRAGSQGRYCFGDDLARLPQYANFADLSLLREDGAAYYYATQLLDDGIGGRPAVVGRYLPNAWGLHDVHGNVSEWCGDPYAAELPGGVSPVGVSEEKNEAVRSSVRGGAWCSTPEYCQAGFRNPLSRHVHAPSYPFTGLRVVLKKVQ